LRPDLDAEWLEADGRGGYASGTVGLARTRRYHALLCAATTPPTGRHVLVPGLDALVETEAGRSWISSQRYAPDVTAPDGARRIVGFARDPWPRWTFSLGEGGPGAGDSEGGARVEHEVFLSHGSPLACVSWRLADGAPRPARASLEVRIFLSGRDHHATHHENAALRMAPLEAAEGRLLFRTYEDAAGVRVVSNGAFRAEPSWYRRFQLDRERERGLDFLEDAAMPGVLTFDLAAGPAVLLLGAEGIEGAPLDLPSGEPPLTAFERHRERERARRAAFATPLERAADAYVATRGEGRTIIAGFPWFTDWGRDTFIAMRGLLLATGRLEEARAVLLAWAGAVSEGMLPNRYPDGREPPEFNSVDASLWFCVVVLEWVRAWTEARGAAPSDGDLQALRGAVTAIVTGYAGGTRFGIRVDERDGLLAAGVPGVQLTWMDAKVDGRVITPRIGKPVEVNALWINALAAAQALLGGREGTIDHALSLRIAGLHSRALASMRARYPHPLCGLRDVVDVDHVRFRNDESLRPNQILAVGGLPEAIFTTSGAFAVLQAVERELWTPLGLRTLAPGDRAYRGRCEGGVVSRDEAYHQGTVWPWLLGPFVEAWVRWRGGRPEAKSEARARFLAPLLAHLEEAGLGHISEIADGDPPHTRRGCPFQAWSVGEALRLDRVVLR